MYLDTASVVDFCAKHRLTFDQFLFCWMTHRKEYAQMYKFVKEVKAFSHVELLDLVDRGFVINKNNGTDSYPDMYVITNKFYKELVTKTGELSKEIWDSYPVFIIKDGIQFPARTIGEEEVEKMYSKIIRGSVSKHKHILEALLQQKKNGLLSCGLEKWLKGAFWESDSVTPNRGYTNDI